GSATTVNTSSSFKPMSPKFQKGVKYNMKVIIRGDIRTGKSTLFHRLQGDPFNQEYTPTPQIQVTNIQWIYKNTDDVIKVEIWDVVDKGLNLSKPSTKSPNSSTTTTTNNSVGLKIENAAASPTPHSAASNQEYTLDAATIDVYRNTHGVILIFDITKTWTFDYAIKEIQRVPGHLAILLLGNFVDQMQIYQAIADCNRLRTSEYPSANTVRYVEASMVTGFGLDYIYRYFGVPFLQLQRNTLRQQLELKTKELVDLLGVLDHSDVIPNNIRKRQIEPSSLDQEDVEDVEDNVRLEQEKEKGQEVMKNLWDKEYEDLVLQKVSDNTPKKSISPKRSTEIICSTVNTTSSPVSPSNQQITTIIAQVTPDVATIDEFNAGQLQDDFFDDDTLDNNNPNNSNPPKPYKNPSFSSDLLPEIWLLAKRISLLERRRSSSDSHGGYEFTTPHSTVIRNSIEHDDGFRGNQSFDMSSGGYTGVSASFGPNNGYEEIGESNDNPWVDENVQHKKEVLPTIDESLNNDDISKQGDSSTHDFSVDYKDGNNDKDNKSTTERQSHPLHLHHPKSFLEFEDLSSSASSSSWGIHTTTITSTSPSESLQYFKLPPNIATTMNNSKDEPSNENSHKKKKSIDNSNSNNNLSMTKKKKKKKVVNNDQDTDSNPTIEKSKKKKKPKSINSSGDVLENGIVVNDVNSSSGKKKKSKKV
ncbi:10353_t:CDS:10, partial [Ambispora gerdemannii]